MVRPRPVVQDLLADLPTDAEAVPTQSMLPPKPKRVKKAQPKAKATDAEAEDAVPISKLAESKKSTSVSTKRSAEGQPSGSTQSKRPRSSFATTSASKKPDVPWAPDLSLEDRPIMASESADDINLDLPVDSPLRNADAIPLPFPPPPEGESESDADAEDEDKETNEEALVRKPKDAVIVKSPPPTEQIMDLTLDEEGDEAKEATKETATGHLSSNLLLIERSVEESLAEIDAEIQADKVADEVPPESSEVPVPAVANSEES
ncbi:nucleolin-like [Camellia sinensis]|uniref:nucleolin-like n=1 Tax=Camellia sinensis TaxID=4442 RepID=UPI001035FB71|nr:nucleolin-like [Camellia sinensis]